MTAPLTPADCDLRGMPFMPLAGDRLIDSDLFLLSSGDEFKAALALWWASWKQVPAASLPNDDRLLAGLARVDLKRWLRLKAVALRGFVLCDDGRLYHPVVAEKAAEAWAARTRNRAKAAKRWEKPKDGSADAAAHAAASPPAYAAALPVDMQGTGTGTVRDSEADASGASPPIDAEKKAWQDAVDLLTTAGRMSQSSARSFIGKLKAEYGIAAKDLLPAIGQCIANGTQDPAAYLRKAARGLADRRSGGTPAPQPADAPVDWAFRVAQWKAQRMWLGAWGPTPLEKGCQCPLELLEAAS